MEISVVYPAYNEEGNIRATVSRSLEALRAQFDRYEVIIVNDCSTDDTARIAGSLAAEHPSVTVLHNERNLGVGPTVLRGLSHARFGLVFHSGMDYPFDLADLARMTPLLSEADVVVAVRGRAAGDSRYRRLISFINRKLLDYVFGLGLGDYNFVQLYRKEVLDAVVVDARSPGFIMPETLIRAHDLGFRIKTVEIEYHPRKQGVSVCGRPGVLLASLLDLVRFRWTRRSHRSPLAAVAAESEVTICVPPGAKPRTSTGRLP